MLSLLGLACALALMAVAAPAQAGGRDQLVRFAFSKLVPAAPSAFLVTRASGESLAACADSMRSDATAKLLHDVDEAAKQAVKTKLPARRIDPGAQEPGPHFRGDEIDWIYATDAGDVRVMAKVDASDGVLSLYSVEIKPVDAGDAGPLAIDPLPIGPAAVRAITNDVISRAREDGYRRIELDAFRVTGSAARALQLTIELQK